MTWLKIVNEKVPGNQTYFTMINGKDIIKFNLL